MEQWQGAAFNDRDVAACGRDLDLETTLEAKDE
jgi:hypothetical protein